jgi:hypothetical protein
MISLKASTDVQAGTPVSRVIASHSAWSRSKPSQPDEVPLQAMTSTRASASRRAACRIGASSNWPERARRRARSR